MPDSKRGNKVIIWAGEFLVYLCKSALCTLAAFCMVHVIPPWRGTEPDVWTVDKLVAFVIIYCLFSYKGPSNA